MPSSFGTKKMKVEHKVDKSQETPQNDHEALEISPTRPRHERRLYQISEIPDSTADARRTAGRRLAAQRRSSSLLSHSPPWLDFAVSFGARTEMETPRAKRISMIQGRSHEGWVAMTAAGCDVSPLVMVGWQERGPWRRRRR